MKPHEVHDLMHSGPMATCRAPVCVHAVASAVEAAADAGRERFPVMGQHIEPIVHLITARYGKAEATRIGMAVMDSMGEDDSEEAWVLATCAAAAMAHPELTHELEAVMRGGGRA